MSLKSNDITFDIRVTPRSSKNEVRVENENIKVYLHTIPEDGKANRECVCLLASFFSVPKQNVTIIRGLKSRSKTVTVKEPSLEKVQMLSSFIHQA